MPKNVDRDQLRKQRNEQLLRRMKAGESLWSYDSKASWFPPRPVIEKDPEAIKRLYDGREGSTLYTDPTVRHIENRLKVITGEKSEHTEEVG